MSTDTDALAYGYPQLVGIAQCGKGLVGPLSPPRFSKKVDIPGEQEAPQRACPVQKLGIGKANRAVLLRSPHVDAAEAQAFSDGARHVHIHVEADAHKSRPAARRRARSGDS